ncbi:hypothetical protein AtNW77_Chr4g0280781 [Arabidopsis thaliana]
MVFSSIVTLLTLKNQDILNAISLVESIKSQLQKLRDDGHDDFMAEVSSFCEENDIGMLIMEEEFFDPKRPRKRTAITNLHHYKMDCFYTVNSEQLICTSSLSPIDSFCQFDKCLLMRLAEFYPYNFGIMEHKSLAHHLDIYFDIMQKD